ncbi:MAG: hypothetical protein NT175_09840 [Bacteroidetes bacterium]|nr:hypothetical protein [Bacteroidota bacterium]
MRDGYKDYPIGMLPEEWGEILATLSQQLPTRKLLEQKLYQAIELAKNQLDHSDL